MTQALSMKRRATWFCTILLSLSLSSTLSAATVYKKIDDNGNLVFSDEPFEGAEALDVPPVPTINLRVPSTPTHTPSTPTKPEPAKGYTALSITSPVNDSSLVNTGGLGTVTVSSSPALQPNHQYKLLINGESKGSQSSNRFPLTNLFRGAHTAVVQIVSDNGEVIIVSPPSTFYVRQHSIKH